MLAWLNATLAILVALLGVAPLTGAPVALALFAPAAIMFAFFGQRTPAVLAAGAVPLAIALSPIKLEQLLHKPASDRHYPRREPYAVVPHVRICEGGVKRLAFLPRHCALAG